MSGEQVRRLAALARLNVPEAELEATGKDIAAILGFVDTIQTAHLSDQVANETDLQNVFREDAVAPLSSAYDLIEAAPLHQDHFVKVPKVIE